MTRKANLTMANQKARTKRHTRLRIHNTIREELIAAAKDEQRHPNQMLNALLEWALEQRELLGFDISKLSKVHLSVRDDADEEPWNHVVSGKLLEDGDGNLQKLIVR